MTDGEAQNEQNEQNEQNDPQAVDRAQAQAQAYDQAQGPMALEFDNRIRPAIDEMRAYRDDLANSGDRAGVAHVSYLLDSLVSRFRIPGGEVESEAESEAETEAEPEPEEQAEEQAEAQEEDHVEEDADENGERPPEVEQEKEEE